MIVLIFNYEICTSQYRQQRAKNKSIYISLGFNSTATSCIALNIAIIITIFDLNSKFIATN